MTEMISPGPVYRVVSLGRMVQGGRWRSEAMRSHAHPVLYWFTRAQGRITVQGVTAGWGPNNAVLLPPGTMHGFDVVGQVQGWALHLPIASAFAPPDQPVHLRLRDVRLQAELGAQIDNIRREIERPEGPSTRALDHHAGLLSVWLERTAGPLWTGAEEGRRAADSLSAAYAALIERDVHRGRGVADFARELGVSPAHLNRSCRAASGRSASALLQDRVIFEARRLLGETRMPVKDVARALGYRSAAYFTRAFHTRTGQTPSDFRRKA